MYVVCTLGVRGRGRSYEDGRNWFDRFVDFSGVGIVGLRREECRQGVISRQLAVRCTYFVHTLYIHMVGGWDMIGQLRSPNDGTDGGPRVVDPGLTAVGPRCGQEMWFGWTRRFSVACFPLRMYNNGVRRL